MNLKQELKDVISFVFNNEKRFIEDILNLKADNLVLSCFYMASERCYYKLNYWSTETVAVESTVETDKILYWYDFMMKIFNDPGLRQKGGLTK